MTPHVTRRCVAIFDAQRTRIGSEAAMAQAIEYATDVAAREAIGKAAASIDPKALEMLSMVAEWHGHTLNELRAGKPYTWVASVRQEAIHVARAVTGVSFPVLAKYFGLDHSTLVHGNKRFERRLATDELLATRVGRAVAAAVEARVAA